MASLGTRINEHRRRRNITQEELAEILGVTSQAVSKWENDISCPDISLMPQISDYFGISLDMLIRGEQTNGARMQQENERKDFNKMVLRMTISTADGDMVNMNLPMPLVKAGIAIGAISIPLLQISQKSNNSGINDMIQQIDFLAIIKLVEQGMAGKLLEVKSADRSIVEIVIE